MKEIRTSRSQVGVHLIDVVGLDAQLRAVARGELRVLDQVHLDLVSAGHDEGVVPVQDLKADAVDEKVETYRYIAVEDLGDQDRQHIHSMKEVSVRSQEPTCEASQASIALAARPCHGRRKHTG